MEENLNPIANENKRNKKNKIFTGITVALIIVMLFFVVINVFIYVNVEVDGLSMYPTLSHQDVVKANKHAKVHHGDIVVIKKTDGTGSYNIVKRVIAMEGDHIEIKDDKVYLNGEILVEEYIKDDPATEFVDESKTWGTEDMIVPEGKFFYLGDNRYNSIDSREDGLGSLDDVIGVVDNWTIATRGIRNFFFDLFYR